MPAPSADWMMVRRASNRHGRYAGRSLKVPTLPDHGLLRCAMAEIAATVVTVITLHSRSGQPPPLVPLCPFLRAQLDA